MSSDAQKLSCAQIKNKTVKLQIANELLSKRCQINKFFSTKYVLLSVENIVNQTVNLNPIREHPSSS